MTTSWVSVLLLGHGIYIIKMHNVFKNSSSLLPVTNQTNKPCRNNKHGSVYQSTKGTPEGGVMLSSARRPY